MPVASGLSSPQQLTVDSAGDLYIADSGNGRVLKVPADGSAPRVVASGLTNPTAVAVNGGAFYAIHVAMGEGTERARLATVEPQVIVVAAPKDGPVLASREFYYP